MREKLAASLINHWFAMERLQQLGLIKKQPPIEKYRERMADVLSASAEDISKLDDHFIRQNKKALDGILSHTLKSTGYPIATVESKNRADQLGISLGTAEFSLDESVAFTRAAQTADQFQMVADLIGRLPPPAISGGNIKFCFNTQDNGAGQYQSFYSIEQEVGEIIKIMGRALSLFRYLKKTLPAPELAEVMRSKVHIIFTALNFGEDNSVVEATYRVQETPESIAEKAVKRRLEEEWLGRRKKVKELVVEAGSVNYKLEEETTIKINLDILTQW